MPMVRRLVCICILSILFGGGAFGVEFINRAFTREDQTVFVSAFQRYARLRNGDGDVRTTYNPGAAAFGFHSLHGLLEVGFAVSYEEGTRKYRGDGYAYKVDSQTAGMTVFAGLNLPLGFYVDQSLYVGYGTFKGKDYHDDGNGRFRRTGDIHKYQAAASLEIGKVFGMPFGWSFVPHAGFEYSRAPEEVYNWGKSGGPRLKYHTRNVYEASAGVTLGKTIRLFGLELTPSVDATAIHSFGRNDSMNYHPGFAYRTAKEWRVAGISGDHVGGRVRAGVDASLGARLRLGAEYTFEKRKGYRDHRVSALLGLSF